MLSMRFYLHLVLLPTILTREKFGNLKISPQKSIVVNGKKMNGNTGNKHELYTIIRPLVCSQSILFSRSEGVFLRQLWLFLLINLRKSFRRFLKLKKTQIKYLQWLAVEICCTKIILARVKKYLKPFPVKISDFNISQENVKLFQVLGCFSVKLLFSVL